ncbi:MAG: SDR family oxidoreductase [Bacteroidales bacterium]|nr:SDR family oxidoreductase [Bacteroidales bacterium]MCB9000096.1 SDR family oxidoreductase [Bacteroidales bacterium]MCB9012745.1 SDR family oxidoreductase [Bacteroidales bacterium]
MKILILGITGRTGLLVAEEALKRGYKVSGIARDPSKINLKDVDITKGTPYDFETVKKAIEGCDAVISTLNIFPASQGIFGKITSPLDGMSVAMKNTVSLMKEKGIKRIILMTALGVGDSANQIPWFFKFLMKISNIKYAYADHDRQEKVLEDSGLDWTVVRPVYLSDENNNLSILHNINGEGFIKSKISRNAVAHLMLDCIEKNLFIHQKPGISND